MTSLQAHLSRSITLATALVLCLCLCTIWTTDSFAANRKHSKDQSGKVRIQNIRNNSEETTAERDRRLYRECQGRPNSGACAGYTQRPLGGKR